MYCFGTNELVEIHTQANLAAALERKKAYQNKGLSGIKALLQQCKDTIRPKLAVINPYRAEAFFNELSEKQKAEVLALTEGVANKTPRPLHQFSPAERYDIGRTLKHLKLLSLSMPEHLQVAEFTHVSAGGNND